MERGVRQTGASLFVGGGVQAQGRAQIVQLAKVEFVVPLGGLLPDQVGTRAVEGLGDV